MRALFVGSALIALSAMLGGDAPARSHFELGASEPAAFATVDTVTGINLWFTEVPAERTTRVRVLDARAEEVPARPLLRDDRDWSAFTLPLRAPLPQGKYRVVWEATGPDGILVRDEFPFVVTQKQGLTGRDPR